MTLTEVYSNFCIMLLILSVILNGILSYAVRQRSKRIGSYRYFTYTFVIVDILYSFTMAVLAPWFVVSPGILTFFPTSSFWRNDLLIWVGFYLWWSTFSGVLVLITLSFVYRYALLCSKKIISFFEDRCNILILIISCLLFVILWAADCVNLMFNYSPGLREKMKEKLSDDFEIDFLTVIYTGFDLSTCNVSLTMIVLGYVMILMYAMIGVTIYCAISINRAIASDAISAKSKVLHAKSLKMLIAQAVNPTIFLYTPPFIDSFGLIFSAFPAQVITFVKKMRLLFLLFVSFAVVFSLKCYDGVVSWGMSPKDAKLTLKNCDENCCQVTWSMPGTIYSCGKGCPKAGQFVKGEKCEQAPTDASWCYCNGLFGQCKPKF
ncbi:hypothetical protein PRIPAC_80305 [Pristionchus pacificus]|uniref:G protein-coupled receptor n=1 Tax=Pristionchus pacificus TaxID=54126 RepID=A0A2A6C4R1_PRIPA|nr:hypothetical protein PRIPAC_80305 [Pristionchus pacificus]|eukprot:PDM73106.1 G protein-coupled receptor [Pristionchus pacificus]